MAIITGRSSPAVSIRAESLDVDAVHLDAKVKLPLYERVLADLGYSQQQTAVIGDDLTDLPLLLRCGFAVAVADAVEEVKNAAGYITKLPGGRGCVREVVELILKGAGKWDRILARYLSERSD